MQGTAAAAHVGVGLVVALVLPQLAWVGSVVGRRYEHNQHLQQHTQYLTSWRWPNTYI